MNIPNSPLFAPQQLSNHNSTPTNSSNDKGTTITSTPTSKNHLNKSSSSSLAVLTPTLPEKPTVSTSSLAVYIVPSEQNLFVQGFEEHVYLSRPPTILRGSLVVKVLKPTKIKSISLTFKGIQRTDWPEGIPPKKNQYNEINEVITHTWPFLQGNINDKLPHNGADYFIEKDGTTHQGGINASFEDDLSSVRSSTPPPLGHLATSPSANLSPTRKSHHDEQSSNNATNFFTRNLSPSFIRRGKSSSISSMAEIGKASSFTDLMPSTSSPGPGDGHSNIIHFAPGDYIYNFEHPLPASIPESCNATFGSTSYYLEVNITRPGAFKTNLAGRLPINIIRTLAETSLEENESIVITRDWEDQLRYDIVIGAKSVVLDLYLPLAFRFVPLWGKVALHRIRVYLTENLEYYCSNKKVHRMEPAKKYLLLEHKAKKGRSLLSSKNPEDESSTDSLNDFDDDILPKELEFQLFVPTELNARTNSRLHPDTSYENIQAHHWIKICLRISKQDPENPEKRKHYEISIDSPLHVLSHLCSHNNTLLPAYDDLIPGMSLVHNQSELPPLSPGVTPVEHTARPRNGSVGNQILGIFNNNGSNGNSQSRSSSVPPENENGRPLTPIEFHHISSGLESAGAVEREADMHLEANLYLPKENAITAINSPQALPHPDTFSSPVLLLPVQRPIHLIRKPSVNPPPFDADVPPPPATIPPPAYEERDSGSRRSSVGYGRGLSDNSSNSRSLSLSPLRIDEPSENGNTTSTRPNVATNGFHSTAAASNTPVRDLLIQQLNGSGSSSLVTPTELVEPTTRIDDNIPIDSSIPQIEIHNENNVEIHGTDASTISNSSARRSSVNSERGGTINGHSEDRALNHETETETEEEEEEDIADYPSPILPPTAIHGMAKISRTSSAASATSAASVNSAEIPVEQTIPLLSLVPSHNSQANIDSYNKGRNESTGSLLYEVAKPTEFYNGLESSAGVDNDFFKVMSSSLSKLRNPRLAKHYQDQQS
ncbi:hypothetical protein GWM34_02697, partial [Candida africana]